MTAGFVARAAELAALRKRLRRVQTSGSGIAVAIHGRRQVGKSRLVQELCDTADFPYVFFTATKGASTVEEVRSFCSELRDSPLPADTDAVPLLESGSWPDAFRVLAAALPERPSIVVIDEMPWLVEQDEVFDGALQTAWDRLLQRRPVLLLLLGSDIHMMERFTSYDAPFYGRADMLPLSPLNPAETAAVVGLAGADAIDAHLVSGGLPGILRTWPDGTPPPQFMQEECADPAAALFSVPESSLLAEFPSPDQARRVLEAVGTGDRTRANIAAAAGGRQGGIPSGSLSPLLERLVGEKHVLAVDQPLSTQPGKPALYRVADSNLRLYLGMLRAAHEQTRRGRPDVAFRLIERRWPSWRGRAVEPLVREALELGALAGALPWPDVAAVGGWWNRQFDPEIDLVGADRLGVATRLSFTGSIKWLGTPFDRHDLAKLVAGSAQVPGASPGETGLVVVSLSGIDPQLGPDNADLAWGPDDILSAW